VLLISGTMITVRKFNEFDSIVLLTYFCIKIDSWQNANLIITNFASFEPVLQKQFFSNSEREVKAKTGFFQQQVYSKYVFGKWISGMCSLLILKWQQLLVVFKHCSATHLSVLEICFRIRLSCVIKYIICFHFLNKSCWLTKTYLNFSKGSFTVRELTAVKLKINQAWIKVTKKDD
jgi:hypothetical protein